jgi:hypothetical protein
MSSAAHPFPRVRTRRRIALAMVAALLIAGVAQAAHFHKSEFAQHNDVHLQCLLCLYSSGTAGPPSVPRLVVSAPIYLAYRLPRSVACPQSADAACYDARGPPVV